MTSFPSPDNWITGGAIDMPDARQTRSEGRSMTQDSLALLKRHQLIYLIEMRLPLTYMPRRLSRQPMAELRSIVRRAIRDGNLPGDRVYQMAQFAPARD